MSQNRWPPSLPIKGRNKGLHAWLNRLMEASKRTEVAIPHNMKREVGPQGTILKGNFGGGTKTTDEGSTPRWG